MAQKLFVDLASGNEAQNYTIGGKASPLLKLSSKFNVPKGFAITTLAFDKFLQTSGISEMLSFDKTSYPDFSAVRSKCKDSKLPESLLKGIEKQLDQKDMAGVPLVVRSSASIEDSSRASFAGRFKTVINVNGARNIEAAIKEVYASTFTKDVLSYCENAGKRIESVKMAIIVQELIVGDVSGVMFTRNPNTFEEKMLIEAVVGLNEGLVSGKVTPSKFVYDNNKHVIESAEYVKQPLAVTVKRNGVGLTENNREIQGILDEKTVAEIGHLGEEIEKVFGLPQDIEWTISKGKIYVLQSRPITTHRSFYVQRANVSNAADVFKGYAASKGVAKGKVALVNSPDETIPNDAVLVAEVVDTDYSIDTIKRAKAIITEDGGILSHAAILARELKIPCVVGVQNIMKKLKNGDFVVVDGSAGVVYKGDAASPGLNTGRTLDYSFIYDFSNMSKLGSTGVYYEQFDDALIYYAEKEMSTAELRKNLGNKIAGKQIILGGVPKYYIYKQYELNNRDPEMNRLSLQAIRAAKSLRAAEIDSVANMLFKTAEQHIKENKEISDKGTVAAKKLMLLNLMRAGWCYTLLNELICEGYAITAMDKKLHDMFKSNKSIILDFTSAIDSGEKFSHDKLNPVKKDELKAISDFYIAVRRWRLDSYPMFETIGATGDAYRSKVSELITALSTSGKGPNEVKEEVIDFSNFLNQRYRERVISPENLVGKKDKT
ncbi:MAG: hypothetical protein JRN26_04870 [Nitrososphaerota archaeon]|nr:hypothetical protein [Nitrososphaerota archaeon]